MYTHDINNIFVDFKSHYIKIKRSKHGYFYHLFKNGSVFEIFSHKAELKLDDLEINKGINDGYLMTLHGSVVELHVGGADQQAMQLKIAETSVGARHKFPK